MESNSLSVLTIFHYKAMKIANCFCEKTNMKKRSKTVFCLHADHHKTDEIIFILLPVLISTEDLPDPPDQSSLVSPVTPLLR